ncbi:VOC family protein [Gordonia sp. CPCC 205333]|uniref:VOC family protein n=1 Tax=Gordonia sp. CPCC 205333 TaxID=3140790 RepID=UPI003AF3A052
MGLAEVILTGTDETLDAYRNLLGATDADAWSLPNAQVRVVADDRAENLVLFGVDDVESASRLLTRRGLTLDPGLLGVRARGLPIGIAATAPSSTERDSLAGILAIDHLVFLAANRDHATALFGATLGLDFRLAQVIPGGAGSEQGGEVSQLFFRDRDLIVEVVVKPDVEEAITFWGIAWRVGDIETSREVLREKGFDVSEIHAGHKPGTRVCTMRDRSLVVPTILIEQAEA